MVVNNVWCELRDCGHNVTGRCTLLSIKLTWDTDIGVQCNQYARYVDDTAWKNRDDDGR